jgi:hypothetical protein
MISSRLQGGLGNQLFQIFTTIAYALTYSKPFFFLNNRQLGKHENNMTIRYTYWETFLSSLKPFLKELHQIPELIILKEQGYSYEILPQKTISGMATLLVGYFQSPLYFDKYKEMIIKILKIDKQKKLLKEKQTNNGLKISMHFRIGDYINYPDVYIILPKTYYKNALNYILDQTNKGVLLVQYFYQEEDIVLVQEIIEYLKIEFPYLLFEKADPLLADWEQLLQMSLCEHNIIANSTFSWWGAYLNNYPNKIVCYPNEWFNKKCKNDTSTLFPDNWTVIKTL